MSTVLLDLYSLTDVRVDGAVPAIGRALDQDVRLRPGRMDVRDPIRRAIAMGCAERPDESAGAH